MQANEEQKKAIEWNTGPALILAGPGSGKTFTTVERVKYLIEVHHADPSHILVITFTKAAARQMRERFLKRMGGKPCPVSFGTFHAIFLHILKIFRGYRSGSILREKEKREYLRTVLSGMKGDFPMEKEWEDGLLAQIGYIKNLGKMPEEFLDCGITKEQFARIFMGFQQLLREAGRLDLDDIAAAVCHLFRTDIEELARWQKQFRYILVDEFQDVNSAQYEAVRLLAGASRNLFVVGDDDQAIYGFRGSDPSVMRRFTQDFPEAVRIELSINYRSQKGIVECAGRLVFYAEKPEGTCCPELMEARERVWEVLRPYRMKLLRLAPAKFIHFGTTGEILELMGGGVESYRDLGWSPRVGSSIPGETAGYNSVLSSRASIGEGCYLEVSYVHGAAKVGKCCVLSFVDIHDETIPDGVVLHGLKQRDGKFVVRIFGVGDNPKENRLFGRDLEEISGRLGAELWEGEDHSLWSAALYPEKDSVKEAVAAALNLYGLVHGDGDLDTWKKAERKSLCSGFHAADPDAIIAWDRRMADLVAMDGIAKAIRNRIPAQQLPKGKGLTKIQKQWLEKRIARADFSEKLRLYYYLGVILEDENEVQKCFSAIQSEVLDSTIRNLVYNENARIIKERHTVKLPLRVNWGGGWSDTPPYCNENGGTVLNMAILLNGEKPVEVTLERTDERKVVFDSRDMDVHGEFTEIEELQQTGDPFDPFALQKACLLACGIIPKEGHSLEEVLEHLGGGFIMHSEVTDVPKGSGLGTSSILSAACVKAVFEFMGIPYTEEDLYSHVLAMEQIMSTGGGWQDQVGGLTPGLKYITSMSGIDQKLKVSHVDIPDRAKKELEERFCLIYTGQRRLARNLLRDVIGRYVGNEPESLFALEEIRKVAALMRFELERGNVDGFAKLLDYHWELSKKVDAGSSNTLIEQIFGSVEEFIDGRLVCGAGGGGFLQVILKKGVTKNQVAERLHGVFMDSTVDVAACSLVWE